MSKETGGPAFPQNNERVIASLSIKDSQGMTLRDYFAAKALGSIVVATMNASKGDAELVARNSYAIADWMLRVREE